MKEQQKWVLGQATSEIIIVTVLVALTVIIVVGLYGRNVGAGYLCVARSLITGESCPGPGAAGPDGAGASADGLGLPAPAHPPSTARTSGPGAAGEPLDRLNEAREMLERTERGQRLLKFLDRNGINIVLGPPGMGTSFRPGRNIIVLDEGLSADRMATAIVHEQTHASFDLGGRTANTDAAIANLTRDEYVSRMIDEESTAVAAEIQLKMELEAAGVGFGFRDDTEVAYREAYERAFNSKGIGRPESRGEVAGRNRIREEFENGNLIPSTSEHETYPELYGRFYDESRRRLGLAP